LERFIPGGVISRQIGRIFLSLGNYQRCAQQDLKGDAARRFIVGRFSYNMAQVTIADNDSNNRKSISGKIEC